MSAQGIPQIAVVMGSCTAGGAYVPAMCDEIDHRARAGHDLPRRPAAGEGRDRRDRQRRGARRRRRARPAFRASPTTSPQDDAHALGDRAAHRRPTSTACKQPHARRCGRRDAPRYDPSELYGVVPADMRAALRRARGDRAHRRRQRVRRVQGAATAPRWSCGFARICGYPVGILANNGILFSEVGAEGRALHRAVQPARHPAGVPAEHHRLHGRPQVRGRRHRQGRRQDGDRRRHARRCRSSR